MEPESIQAQILLDTRTLIMNREDKVGDDTHFFVERRLICLSSCHFYRTGALQTHKTAQLQPSGREQGWGSQATLALSCRRPFALEIPFWLKGGAGDPSWGGCLARCTLSCFMGLCTSVAQRCRYFSIPFVPPWSV